MLFYFLVWVGLAFMIIRAMRRNEAAGGAADNRRIQTRSAVGLLLYFLTATFASFDWMMSLEPHWYSTIYGMQFIVSQVLTTFSFAIIMVVMMMEWNPGFASKIKQSYVHDLGNLLFAFTMLWAYLGVSQFLIIWSGNIPEEATWYWNRATGGWQVIPIVLSVFHFLAPFLLLLSRKMKQSGRMLVRVALLIFPDASCR